MFIIALTVMIAGYTAITVTIRIFNAASSP
jgi:hypothetical protein